MVSLYLKINDTAIYIFWQIFNICFIQQQRKHIHVYCNNNIVLQTLRIEIEPAQRSTS